MVLRGIGAKAWAEPMQALACKRTAHPALNRLSMPVQPYTAAPYLSLKKISAAVHTSHASASVWWRGTPAWLFLGLPHRPGRSRSSLTLFPLPPALPPLAPHPCLLPLPPQSPHGPPRALAIDAVATAAASCFQDLLHELDTPCPRR